MVLVGLGTGAFTQSGYAVIQAMTEPQDLAYAISFMMLGTFLPIQREIPFQAAR
jgi:predicted MFS family arabinose efflux permease